MSLCFSKKYTLYYIVVFQNAVYLKLFLLVGLFLVDFHEQLKLLIELPEIVRIYVEKWQHAGWKEWY